MCARTPPGRSRPCACVQLTVVDMYFVACMSVVFVTLLVETYAFGCRRSDDLDDSGSLPLYMCPPAEYQKVVTAVTVGVSVLAILLVMIARLAYLHMTRVGKGKEGLRPRNGALVSIETPRYPPEMQ